MSFELASIDIEVQIPSFAKKNGNKRDVSFRKNEKSNALKK